MVALPASEDGFLANITIVDDPAFQAANPAVLATGVAQTRPRHAVAFVADATTLAHADRPILCIDPSAPQNTFRVIPSQLWGVENNLSPANMDWEEFAGAVEADGIIPGIRLRIRPAPLHRTPAAHMARRPAAKGALSHSGFEAGCGPWIVGIC